MNTHHHAHLWPGVPLALGAAALFGAAAPFSKLLMGAVDAWLLAGVLYLGAGIGLLAVLAGRGLFGLKAEAPLGRADVPWLGLVIMFGGCLGPVFLMLGLAQTTASAASLLLNVEGLATMAIAWAVFRENVDRRLMLGALCILAGAVVLTWRGSGGTGEAEAFGPGAGLVLLACLCWGIDNNLTRKIAGADPVQIAMIKGLVAGSVNVGLALWQGARVPAAGVLVAGGTLGFAAVGLSLVMFILALRHLGTARTGAYFALAPFIGALLAVGVLGETVTIALLAAGALMAVGLWLHLAERHDHDHAHEAMAHAHMHVHDAHHQHGHDGPVTEPHSHWHEHAPLRHAHVHYPDLHHRHGHHRHGHDRHGHD